MALNNINPDAVKLVSQAYYAFAEYLRHQLKPFHASRSMPSSGLKRRMGNGLLNSRD